MDLLWLLICLYGFPILLIAFCGVIAAWVIYEHWLTPKESKMIRKASRKKKPIVWLAGDDGYADVEVLEVFGREGYAATSKDAKKKWIGFFPRSLSDKEESKEEEKSKAEKLAAFMNRLSSRKLFLRGAKIPVWFSYSGKAILTSLYSLISLDLTKEIKKGGNPDPNPKAVVDLVELKSLFDKPWDESQQRANEEDARIEGMSEGKKFFGLEGWKPLVIPVGIILALIMGVIVLSVVFLR